MTSKLTRWMWVWLNSGSWWWTGRPGVLWFMGWQRGGHNWATDLIWSNENSERDGNTRPPDLPPEKCVCRSRSDSENWTRNNRLVTNQERSTSRLYIVTLLIYFYAEYHMRNAGLEETQGGIKIAGEISITSDRQVTPPLWQKAKRN